MKARVYVTLKSAVLDPQGKAVCHSLHSLGYDEVEDVRLGKYLVLTLEKMPNSKAEKKLDEMCRKLLANTIIEDYRFELEEE